MLRSSRLIQTINFGVRLAQRALCVAALPLYIHRTVETVQSVQSGYLFVRFDFSTMRCMPAGIILVI